MHLLYVDDSGSVENPQEKHFVLGGVAVFERGIYHVIQALDEVVEKFGLGGSAHDIELHGTDMYGGRCAPWRSLQRAERERFLLEALSVVRAQRSAVRLFGIAVDKAHVAPKDPVEYGFEEICNRFNLYIRRTSNRDAADRQRGLIIMDESHHEQPLQSLARHFRVNGTRWGRLRTLAEVPLFVDSRASRLVQLADLVAYALWRRFEHKDGRFFDPIVPHFDAEGGVIHGLVHYRQRAEACYCPACMSRSGAGHKLRAVTTNP